MIAATTIEAIDLLRGSAELRTRLAANANQFRAGMEAAGFALAGSGHPIIPVMLGDAELATEMSNRLLAQGIYVIGFSFPVVPRGEARIRTQMSAAHTPQHINAAIEAFTRVGRELGVVA
jgi:glycine C-acetyltransferase